MAFNSRRDLGLQRSLVSAALPEHFTTSYPKLVSFLDTYYGFMRTDDSHGFDTTIANLIKSKDLMGNDLISLENAMAELTNGIDYSNVISDPRLKSQLLANFYRSKGSLHSIELFFRWLYGQDVTVEYGKKSVFTVGESEIGPQSLKYIKNDELYQTFALLIKVGIPVSKWRDNYKRFAHPAGFYYQGEVVIESSIDLNYRTMPDVIKDGNAGTLTVENSVASIGITPFTSITGLYPDSLDADGDDERISFDRTIGSLSALTIAEMDNVYNSIEDVIDANSPTFDEFDDGAVKAVRFSSTIETFDQDHFDMGQAGRYVSTLADSDVTLPRFDNLSFTMDNGRITMDNVE